jgi:acetoacetyl-CoA synthetase
LCAYNTVSDTPIPKLLISEKGFAKMTDPVLSNAPLWTPSPSSAAASLMARFAREMETKTGALLPDYDALWRWSTRQPEAFWPAVWDFCGVIGEKGATILENGEKMPGARFFPEAKLNWAENLLKRRDDGLALVFLDEKGRERFLTRRELASEVGKLQQILKNQGVVAGDRVAGYMPNMPETLIAALAATSLGAVWSSASPDFGVQGVLDRFGQIEPKVLFTVDGYFYNGKTVDCLEKLGDIVPKLPSVQPSALHPHDPEFVRVSFNHPLFIMFSSGTTGIPKCIVHGHGGTLLEHLKEHQFKRCPKSGTAYFISPPAAG